MEDRLLRIFREYEEGKCQTRRQEKRETWNMTVQQLDSQMPVDTEWKDIYQDKQIIIKEQYQSIYDGFVKAINNPTKDKMENIKKMAQIQANLVYETMLKDNLQLYIKKLSEAIMKTKAKKLTELKTKEMLKERANVVKAKQMKLVDDSKMYKKCLEILERKQ